MEVIDPNLGPLSAFETLELIRNLKNQTDQIIQEQQDLSNSSSDQNFNQNSLNEHLNPINLQNLIQNFINHFESDHLPQSKQNSTSLLNLLKNLRSSKFSQIGGKSNGLTKAERLQICDLAPIESVEIHLIVEECESRFTEDEIEEILRLVRESLSSDRKLTLEDNQAQNSRNHHPNGTVPIEVDEEVYDHDIEINFGDVDDDDALVAEAREGGPAADQELDEVPD